MGVSYDDSSLPSASTNQPVAMRIRDFPRQAALLLIAFTDCHPGAQISGLESIPLLTPTSIAPNPHMAHCRPSMENQHGFPTPHPAPSEQTFRSCNWPGSTSYERHGSPNRLKQAPPTIVLTLPIFTCIDGRERGTWLASMPSTPVERSLDPNSA